MKNLNRLARAIACGGLSLVMAGGVALPVSAFAADKGTCSNHSNKVTANHRELRAFREKMLTEAKSNDAVLQKLVAELNQAPEAKKADVEATIINKLVAQNHERVQDWESLHARFQQFNQQHRQISKSTATGNSSTHGMLSQNGVPEQK